MCLLRGSESAGGYSCGNRSICASTKSQTEAVGREAFWQRETRLHLKTDSLRRFVYSLSGFFAVGRSIFGDACSINDTITNI